jgi:hypothetical protein
MADLMRRGKHARPAGSDPRDLRRGVGLETTAFGGPLTAWKLADVCFDVAARAKERRLASRLRSLADVRELFTPAYQRKHAMPVRRDVQRLDLLGRRVAVPPTALLNASWTANPTTGERLRETLLLLGAGPSLASAILERTGETSHSRVAQRGDPWVQPGA